MENISDKGMEEVEPARNEQDLISWESAHDPQNPRNWSQSEKWLTTFTVSLFAFISPVVSTMIAPAVDTISREFDVTEPVVGQLMLSIFVLAYCFGPLLFAPLSELYGRRLVLQGGNMLFLAFNLGCGFTKNSTQMCVNVPISSMRMFPFPAHLKFMFLTVFFRIICRFLAGLGGSSPVSVGAGVISDIWEPHQRGRAVALYSLTPLFGPTVGECSFAIIWIVLLMLEISHRTHRWGLYHTKHDLAMVFLVHVPGLRFVTRNLMVRVE